MITSLGFKAKARPQKFKKARYAIEIVSEKDISKIIKEFEKIDKLPYENKNPNHEPTASYFRPKRQLEKCMMRFDNLNWYDHGGYTKMTAPYWNVNATNESESKRSIVNEKLSQSCSTNEKKIKTQYYQRTFIVEMFRGRERITFYEGRRIRMRV